MCTIEKMEIRGIRSFSPLSSSVITFSKPLCLIVGHNGAGKTTIIECLKQACTGELPPNCRSGHSFIHDPKISGDHEVRGQVKLKIIGTQGVPVVVTRSFMAKQTQKTLQFKSLDASLTTRKEGTSKAESISYKCAEVDKMVPSIMGVSEAVLENVIFVHQEDSTWPLAEGSVLKKKFDDIFAATKYSKALEQLHRLVKEQKALAKEAKLKLETCRVVKEQAEKLRRDIRDNELNAQNFQEKIEAARARVETHKEQLRAANEKLRRIAELSQEITDLQARHEVQHKQLTELRTRMGPQADFKETLEELEKAMDEQVEGKMAAMRAEMHSRRHDMSLKGQELDAMKAAYSDACKRQGRLVAEVDQLTEQVKQRDALLSAEGSKLGVTGLGLHDGRLSDDQVQHGLRSLSALADQCVAELQAMKDRHRRADEALAARVDAATAELTAASEVRRAALGRREASDRKAAALQARLAGMPATGDALREAEERERQAREVLMRKQQELSEQDLESRADELVLQVADATRKAQRLRARRDQLAQAAASTARLRVKRQDLASKEQQLEGVVTGGRAQVEAVLGVAPGADLPAPVALADALDARAGELGAEAERVEARAQAVTHRCREHEAALAVVRGEAARLGAEEESLQSQLDAVMATQMPGPSAPPLQSQAGFEQALQDLEERLQAQMTAREGQTVLIGTWEAFAKRGRKHGKCAVCQRAFHGEEELHTYVTFCERERARLQESWQQGDAEVSADQRQMERFKLAQPLWARLREVQQSLLPDARTRVAELEAELARHKERQEEADGAAEQARGRARRAAEAAAGVGAEARRLAKEAAALREEVGELEARAGAAGGPVGDAEAVSRELEAEEARRTSLEREREEAMRQLAALKDAVVAAGNAWRDAKEETAGVQARLREGDALREQLAEVERERASALAEAEKAGAAEAPLEARREEARAQRAQERDAAARAEAAGEERLRAARAVLDRVRQAAEAVAALEKRGAAGELAALGRELQRQEGAQRALEEEMRALQADLDGMAQSVSETEAIRKAMQEAVDLRRLEKDVAALGARVRAALEQREAVGDARDIQQAVARADAASREAQHTLSMAEGAQATVRHQAQRAKEELADVKYRDVDERYRAQSVEQHTAEMCISDLEKYSRALEKALLAFHGEKMEEINQTIKELWQRTYRNQDIDSIQIRAEADTTSARRSYNYRVVMHVGGTELDMRGRCSAGQKVLACLIIRLALSETFCINCGILALDEPTTNLDTENAASLAEALRALMDARRQNSNFQLVVITHDESFAHRVGSRELADHMWRVTKDANQHSRIEKELI